MTTIIQAKISNLPADIFEYGKGNFFRLSRTIEGRIKPLTDDELSQIKARLTAVVDEALLTNHLININEIGSFELNTANRTFYAYNDKNGSFSGSYADQIASIKEATIATFLGTTPDSTPSNIKDSSDTKPSDSTTEASDEKSRGLFDTENFEINRKKAAKNFKNDSLITAESLAAYSLILENKYSNDKNKIIILDPAIIQDRNIDHPKVRQAINLFNSDPALRTVYLPIHLGSRPGHFEGHWILTALTRGFDNSNTAIVYNSLGTTDDDLNFLTELQNEISSDTFQAGSASNSISHQKDGTSCGVHILHFIDTMESNGFDKALVPYMEDAKFKVNASEVRKKIARELKDASLYQFQVEKTEANLRAAKVYHSSKENKFVGVDELKKIHSAQLQSFIEKRANPNAIMNAHFDWWIFPTMDPSQTYGNLYALDDTSVEKLRNDKEFMNNYFQSIQLVLEAYRWTLSHSPDTGFKIAPIEDTVYDIEEVRLSKMVQSASLFIPELHKAFIQWSNDYPVIKDLIKDPRTKAAFGSAPSKSFFNFF